MQQIFGKLVECSDKKSLNLSSKIDFFNIVLQRNMNKKRKCKIIFDLMQFVVVFTITSWINLEFETMTTV